jgi:hypothetical protein
VLLDSVAQQRQQQAGSHARGGPWALRDGVGRLAHLKAAKPAA